MAQKLKYDYMGNPLEYDSSIRASTPLKPEARTPKLQTYSSYFNPAQDVHSNPVSPKQPAVLTPNHNVANTPRTANMVNSASIHSPMINTPKTSSTQPQLISTPVKSVMAIKTTNTPTQLKTTNTPTQLKTTNVSQLKTTNVSQLKTTNVSQLKTTNVSQLKTTNTPTQLKTTTVQSQLETTPNSRGSAADLATVNVITSPIMPPDVATANNSCKNTEINSISNRSCKYTNTEVNELLKQHFCVMREMWDHLPISSFVRYIRSGTGSREDRFRYGGYIKSFFMSADGVKYMLLESRRGGRVGDHGYFKYSIALNNIDEIWKQFGGDAFIELYLLQNSLLRKDREITTLTNTVLNLISRIENLEKKTQ